MDYEVKQIIGVLAVAMIVAIAARRFELPYTVGLVATGAVLALSKGDFGVPLTHDLIFHLILPPLLFEAALTLSAPELLRDAPPIFVLSGLGTIIAMSVVASGMMLALDWPAPTALVFGALIAATDPVAIIAMFKDHGLEGRLRVLVESESLFNDGIAAVLFVAALSWAQGDGGGPARIETAGALARIVFGGVAIGMFCAGAVILVAWRTSEHMIEAALTTVAAFGSFFLAEQLQVSGVLATVATGLLIGNLGLPQVEGKTFLSMRGREFILAFWEFAAFLANSVVFLLIGVAIATMSFDSHGIEALPIAIGVTLVARGLTVYPLSFLFRRSTWAISLREQHVLWWSGLRGALALALALSLPPTLPLRNEIVVVTFGVVAFSIVLQGLTVPILVRRMGFL